MDILKQTKELCRIYEIKPARSKGQNFLIKESIYDDIVEAADLTKDDTVLEVGPGLGFLTAKLAKKVGKVIAVELDDKLAEVLQIGLDTGGVKNVEVINEDILKPKTLNLKPKTYKVVANLPYNITSIFLRKVLEQENKPSLMVLMLQREVAERLAAKPGAMSLLAVSVQFYAEVKIIENVKKEDFWPEPEVESAVVALTPHSPLPSADGRGVASRASRSEGKRGVDEKKFFQLVKIGFSARRKMLKNNLANGYHLNQAEVEKRIVKAGLNSKIRAQDLSVEDWKMLLPLFV